MKISKVQLSICKYVAEFRENIFAFVGGMIFGKICGIKVNSVKRFYFKMYPSLY
jgi:hypothetical protein